jgi:hypothetical protein
MSHKIATLTVVVVIAAIIGSALAVSVAFTVAANPEPPKAFSDRSRPMLNQLGERGMFFPMHRNFSARTQWNQSWSGNVTIDSEQAKTVVSADIQSFKLDTPIALRAGWLVPIEDGKGVVASMHVTNKTGASTVEQAKSIVEESLSKGWKAGEPRLMRTVYSVPLLDSNDTIVGHVGVDGRSGEIITRPSTTLTVTGEQAKSIVNDAVKLFTVGEAKDRSNMWMVSVTYNGTAVMNVPLGKLNTPTSGDAVKAVQDSMTKGWSVGEPKQLGFIYNVPIVDANGNVIGYTMVNGSTGHITAGFPMLRRAPAPQR